MSLYEDVEAKITEKFVANTALEFKEEACTNDIDSLIRVIGPPDGEKNGVLYVFGGGARPPEEPFGSAGGKGRIWKWRLGFIFFVKYLGDSVQIETDIREFADVVKGLLDDDPRLGDTVVFAEIQNIDGPPEEVLINDFPFMSFTATMEFWEKI